MTRLVGIQNGESSHHSINILGCLSSNDDRSQRQMLSSTASDPIVHILDLEACQDLPEDLRAAIFTYCTRCLFPK